MKQELLKNLTPVIEKFADDVLSSFGDIEKIRKDITLREGLLQELVSQKETELSNIRIQKTADKEEYDRKITDTELAKNEHNQKAKSYDDLIDEMDRSRKETKDDLDKARIELIRSKDIRLQAENTKMDSDKTRNNYNLKLESLKHDSDKIAQDQKKIDQDKIKLTAREQEIFKNESRQSELAKDLSDRETEIKAERKEIDRLIKLYKLRSQ